MRMQVILDHFRPPGFSPNRGPEERRVQGLDYMALSRKLKTLQKLPGKSRGIAWKDKDVEELIELMKEEAIMFSLENATTPKEKRALYKSVQVQLQNFLSTMLAACALGKNRERWPRC